MDPFLAQPEAVDNARYLGIYTVYVLCQMASGGRCLGRGVLSGKDKDGSATMLQKFKKKEDKPKTPAWLASLLGKSESPFKPFADVPLADIRKAFENLTGDFPPVLDLEQAAGLAHLAPSTIKRKVSEGRFKESVKRGKPLLFWRDKFVKELMK